MFQNINQYSDLFESAKAFAAAVNTVFQLGLMAVVVRYSFKAGDTIRAIINYFDSLKNNHLAHIEKNTKEVADRLVNVEVALKLHDNNESAHHTESLRILAGIKSDGCDRRCSKH